MVKQTKTFKKGNVTKKALSAILAASMVMTSSSFVMAAPADADVIVEDAAVEATAVEEVVGVEETEPVAEENVGADATIDSDIQGLDPEYFITSSEGVDGATERIWNVISNATFKKSSVADRLKISHALTQSDYYDVKINGEQLSRSNFTAQPGTYTITIEGKNYGGQSVTGTARATFSIAYQGAVVNVGEGDYNETVALADDVLDRSYTYTGNPIEPVVKSVTLDGQTLTKGSDYTVSYRNNTELGRANNSNVEERPAIVITFVNGYRSVPSKTIYFTIGTADIANADIEINNKTQETEYNGSAQVPVVDKVTMGSKTLEKDKDYAVKLINRLDISNKMVDSAVDAGVYDIYVVGKGNYTGQVLLTGAQFEITKRELSQKNVTIKVDDVEYTGNVTLPSVFGLDNNGNWDSNKKSVVTVIDESTKKPIDRKDYKILFVTNKSMATTDKNPVSKDLGSYEIEIVPSATSNYKESNVPATATYNVVLNSLAFVAKDANLENGVLTYNGVGQLPTSVTLENDSTNKKALATDGKKEFDNYIVEFPKASDCVNAGTYEIKLTGRNKYAGQTATIPFTIVPATLPKNNDNDNRITVNPMYAPISHVGNPEKPFVDLVLNVPETTSTVARTYQLVEGTDFTAVADTKANTVTVTGKGNFTGKQTYNYTDGSTQTNLNDTAIQVTMKKTFAYSAKAIEPTYDDFELAEVGPNGNRPIVGKADYVIKGYIDNVEVGTGYIIVEAAEGTENSSTNKISYTGTRLIPFEIAANEVATVYKLDTSKVKAEVPYDGKAHQYAVRTSNVDGAIMIKTVKDNAYAAVNEVESVKYFRDGRELKLESDAFEDFKAPGTITVEVKMKNYSGKLTYSYTIVGEELSKVVSIDYNIPDQQYTGKEIKPEVKITEKDTAVGTIKEGRDYQITYVNNIERGRAYAVVEGIGNYSGKYYVPFSIVGQEDQTITVLAAQARDIQNRTLNSKPTVVKFEAGKAPKTAVTYASSDEDVVKVDETGKITYTGLGEATITIKAAETAEYKAAEATMTVKVGLAKPSFTPFSKNNAFTLTSSTVKGAEKFEVQYATKKDFSNKKSKTFTTTSAGKVRQVTVSASDKKTYYVRVRAISGTTKSAWSTTKTVATK